MQKYPGQILLCNRMFILDTHNKQPISGTTKLHKVKSVAADAAAYKPHKFALEVANLPCNCKSCAIDPNNDVCPFTPWRKRRMLHVFDNVEQTDNSSESETEDDSESSGASDNDDLSVVSSGYDEDEASSVSDEDCSSSDSNDDNKKQR